MYDVFIIPVAVNGSVLLFCFVLFLLFRATPAAHRGSQVRGRIETTAYATATAMWDPRRFCDLHHSSWQRQILNPLSKARDGTLILTDPSWDR